MIVITFDKWAHLIFKSRVRWHLVVLLLRRSVNLYTFCIFEFFSQILGPFSSRLNTENPGNGFKDKRPFDRWNALLMVTINMIVREFNTQLYIFEHCTNIFYMGFCIVFKTNSQKQIRIHAEIYGRGGRPVLAREQCQCLLRVCWLLHRTCFYLLTAEIFF